MSHSLLGLEKEQNLIRRIYPGALLEHSGYLLARAWFDLAQLEVVAGVRARPVEQDQVFVEKLE